MGVITTDSAGEGLTAVRASGLFDLSCAAEARAALAEALESAAAGLVLDLGGVEGADLTFFQLLFALCLQARLDGKRIVMDTPLPEPLRRAAENMGFSQRDFHQAFCSGDGA